MKTVAFFNNKGGVGKTSLVYHLAWMFSEMGVSTLAVDLDPQSNLTSMFLDEERLVELWENGNSNTISDCLTLLIEGTGDILPPHIEQIQKNLGLISGNLSLAKFEDDLSSNWTKCLDESPSRGFLITTAFYRIILKAVESQKAELVLIDVGPNLGAINRAALIATENVVVPLAPDLYSLQGLKNLGPTLRNWRKGWSKRKSELPESLDISLPTGNMEPIGYIVMQHSIKDSRPVKAYQRWMKKMPSIYREYILDDKSQQDITAEDDIFRLAALKHYKSLMPLAQEAHKPMFLLKSKDGAIGSHLEAVKLCGDDFMALAIKISENIKLSINTTAET